MYTYTVSSTRPTLMPIMETPRHNTNGCCTLESMCTHTHKRDGGCVFNAKGGKCGNKAAT